MSLGKLLATGRSLVGGAADAGRYNLSSHNRLPKFNSAKNPFVKPAAVEAQAVAVEPTVEVELPRPVAPAAPEAFTKTQRIPALADQPVRANTIASFAGKAKQLGETALAFGLVAVAKGQALFGRLTKRFRKAEPRSVIPRFGKPAVQAELSLDNVRVVRNDLEESDLEIVTAETATSTQLAPTTPVATPNRGPVPPALKKLTDRILGPRVLG
jgi:hypothetical protein